jgi:hypothetical protein
MPRCQLFLTIALLPAGFAGLRAQHAVPPAPVGGHLARAALLSGPPLTTADVPADLSSADRLRLLGYIDRRATTEPPIDGAAADRELAGRRAALQREMSSVIERPGIEEDATTIVKSAPLSADTTADPEAEAEWAEGVLREHRSSPAAPYLYAFLASRYRLTFEQVPESERSLRERLARKYKTMLDRVRSTGDSLLVLLADDLDGLPRLSPEADAHPREYLPDT